MIKIQSDLCMKNSTKFFYKFYWLFPWQILFIDKRNMKLKLTLSQLKKVLQTEKAKYPITIIMKGIDEMELEELIRLLKAQK